MDLQIAQAVENHPCEGCHYWRDAGLCFCCHYLLVTGKMRGCEPGENCIRRIPADEEVQRKERRLMFHQMFCERGND